MACGETGLGDLISETESGRPLGISVETARASRREEEECLLEELECLLEEDDLDDDLLEEEDLDDLLDFSDGTSSMFNTRPVVGSVVEALEGSWETWYPSMM